MTALLDRPATIGDIIVWNLALPVVLGVAIVFPIMPRIVGRFETMFASLGGKLPLVTELVLHYSMPIYVGVGLVALGLTYLALFRLTDVTMRVIVVITANWLTASAIGLGILAVFYPILELQSAVRGG